MAATAKKSVKAILADEMKTLEIVSLNGSAFFGELTRTDAGAKITRAIVSGASIRETARAWIKARNLNELVEVVASGNISLVTKSLTEGQYDEVEQVILEAAVAEATAVQKLINSAF